MSRICFSDLSPAKTQNQLQISRTALRYSILLSLTGVSARALAVRVATSQLFQWFVCADRIDAVQTASKSAIDRYGKLFPAERHPRPTSGGHKAGARTNRQVKNGNKILSLYDPDVHVLVRSKAAAEVEFGNGLYLTEQDDGLIVDWDFMREQPRADCKLTDESIERLTGNYGKPEAFTADRGFPSAANSIILEELSIINGVCPKPIPEMMRWMAEDEFPKLQKRRASTEARISIFKNRYLGKPLRSRNLNHKGKKILWAILAHNLWKLVSMAVENQKDGTAPAAA